MRQHAAIAFVLIAATAVIYVQVRNHAFVDLDDYINFHANENLAAGLSPQTVWRSLTTPYEDNWIPLSSISHQIDRSLWGPEPAGFLLTNVALHAASSVLLYAALAGMTGALWPSAFVASIFAVHPLHVESVAWASERKDVLSGLFFMLTLLAYHRFSSRPSLPRYGLVALCVSLGLMAKPMLVTLPCVLLLLDYWPLGRLRADPARVLPDARRTRRALLEKVPLLALAAAVSAITVVVQRDAGAMVHGEELSLQVRVLNALQSYVVYVAKSVWPTGLAVLYPHPGDELDLGRAAAAGIAIAGVSAAAVALARARPYLLVGWLWYLGMLVPVIGVVQVGMQSRADRYMYLPLIGLSIMVAWGVPDLLSRLRWRRFALAGAGAACVIALGACAYVQVGYWKNTQMLFERTLSVTRDNWFAHHRLATVLGQANRFEEARAHYEAALRIRPEYADSHMELAGLLDRNDQLDEALVHYRRGLELRPNFARGHGFMGLALIRADRFEEAAAHIAYALLSFPESVDLQVGMARVSTRMGRPHDAAMHYREALRMEPRHPLAVNKLAWILATTEHADLRDPDEAVRLAEPLVERARRPKWLDTLAAAYAASGRLEEAVRLAGEAAARAEEEDAALAETIRARLASYRAGRPWIERAVPAARPRR